MQGINISNIMLQSYSDISKYAIFFFEGVMPLDLQSIPFDITNVEDLRDNCSKVIYNVEPKNFIRTANQVTLPINSLPSVISFSDTPTGFSVNNFRLPLAKIGYATEDVNSDTYIPPLVSDSVVGSNFIELEESTGKRDLANSTHFSRVGREGSSVVIDLGSDLTQDYAERLYYYVDDTATDLFIDDTVFVHHLNKVQTDNPGVYDNTFVFASETIYFDDHGQQVFDRSYSVDLIAGGVEQLKISLIKNSQIVSLSKSPYVSPELVVDTSLGFLEHSIPQQSIPVLVNGISFTQTLTPSIQRRSDLPSRFNRSYDRRCMQGRVDVWNALLNEGQGGWELGEVFDTNSNNVSYEFSTPISQARYMRFTCLSGMIIPGFILAGGDPHFALGSISLHTKAPSSVVDTLPINSSLTWAMVIPLRDDFDLSQASINGTSSFAGGPSLKPFLICDVGLSGSGSAIELDRADLVEGERPSMSKMNFVFND